jgi:hypothetical protein
MEIIVKRYFFYWIMGLILLLPVDKALRENGGEPEKPDNYEGTGSSSNRNALSGTAFKPCTNNPTGYVGFFKSNVPQERFITSKLTLLYAITKKLSYEIRDCGQY